MITPYNSSTLENAPAISDHLEKLYKASINENTRRAYAADLAHFEAFCKGFGMPLFDSARRLCPVSPELVANYVASLDLAGAKYSTIARRVACISTAHNLAGVPSPCSSPRVRKALKGITHEKTVSTTKKTPVRVVNLRAALSVADSTKADVRDRALILIGYTGAFRRSELVALNIEDLEKRPEGYAINVRKSKTDQKGEGFKKAIPYGSNPDTCPVRALDRWLSILGEGAQGPLFRRIRKGDALTSDRITDKTACRIVKDLAESMGVDPSTLGGHSLRAGFVTDAYSVGAPEASIMSQTGHRSHSVMKGYRREANLFKETPATLLGL